MKKLLVLSFVLCLALIACTTGPLRDIRIGKTYGLFVPREVAIHRAPIRGSETFHLEEAEAFIVDTALCDGGGSLGSCWADLMATVEDPESFGAVFYRVVFESGTEGYINGRYFYPKLADGLISEESAKALGTTPEGFALKARKMNEEGRAQVAEAEEKRKHAIESAPWPEDIKRLVLEWRIIIGMTKEQVFLSQNPPDIPPFKQLRRVSEQVTSDGVAEKWVYKGTSYYFLNDILERWESSDNDPSFRDGQRLGP